MKNLSPIWKQNFNDNQINASLLDIYLMLSRLYIESGRKKDVDQLIDRFKSVMNPENLKDHLTLGYLLKRANRGEDVLQLFKKLEAQYPEKRILSGELPRFMKN